RPRLPPDRARGLEQDRRVLAAKPAQRGRRRPIEPFQDEREELLLTVVREADLPARATAADQPNASRQRVVRCVEVLRERLTMEGEVGRETLGVGCLEEPQLSLVRGRGWPHFVGPVEPTLEGARPGSCAPSCELRRIRRLLPAQATQQEV